MNPHYRQDGCVVRVPGREGGCDSTTWKGVFTRSVFQPVILGLLTQRFSVSIVSMKNIQNGSATHSVHFS